jgi:hypothetical protein
MICLNIFYPATYQKGQSSKQWKWQPHLERNPKNTNHLLKLFYLSFTRPLFKFDFLIFVFIVQEAVKSAPGSTDNFPTDTSPWMMAFALH